MRVPAIPRAADAPSYAGYRILPAERCITADDATLEELVRDFCPWVTADTIFLYSLFGAGPWLQQGWKLHVSATPANAESVFARAAPVLLETGVRFKAVSSRQHLLELNGGAFGLSQVGKFLTIYPSSDDEAASVATKLDHATSEFRGPEVPSDRRLGPRSLVHYRYGAFREIADGTGASMFDNEGRLTPDYRLPYYLPSRWTPNPFGLSGGLENKSGNHHAFAGRFLILQAIGRSVWGRVYDAVDLDSRPPRRCVIMEFWHDVAPDPFNRDALHHAAVEASTLVGYPDTSLPGLFDVLEHEDNVYLVIEHLDGHNLVERYGLGLASLEPVPADELRRLARKTAEALAELHGHGIVHRDVKPSNIVATAAGRIRLIDVAFAYRLHFDVGPPIGFGTPGFASPEQADQSTPRFSDDVYAWGATLHLLATGEIPGGVGALRHRRDKGPRLRDARCDLSPSFCDLIDRALSPTQDERFDSFSEVLSDVGLRDPRGSRARRRAGRTHSGPNSSEQQHVRRQWLDLAVDVARVLIHHAERRGDGLQWESQSSGDHERARESYPTIYAGSAGIALFLAHLSAITGLEEVRDAVERAARCLAAGTLGHGSTSVGLYSGEAGLALFYARVAAMLHKPAYLRMAALRAERLRTVDTSADDLADGVAGLLLVLLEIAALTGNADFRARAIALGDRLLSRTCLDEAVPGLVWDVSGPVPGAPPARYLGLLHGSAGIGLALLVLGDSVNEPRFCRAASEVGIYLLEAAHRDQVTGHHHWPRIAGEQSVPRLAAHCHGAGGVAQFLVRLWGSEPADGLLAAAHGAADAVAKRTPRDLWQCHGLAGDASLFLDMYQATREERYRDRALLVGSSLAEEWQTMRDAMQTKAHPAPHLGYMTGLAGIGFLFLRLHAPESARDMLLPGLTMGRPAR